MKFKENIENQIEMNRSNFQAYRLVMIFKRKKNYTPYCHSSVTDRHCQTNKSIVASISWFIFVNQKMKLF